MYIKKFVNLFWNEVKSIFIRQKVISVCIILLYTLLLPIWNWKQIVNKTEYSKFFVNDDMLYLIPVSISIWVLSIMYDDFNGKGKELIYLYEREDKKIWTVFGLHLISMSIPFVIVFGRLFNSLEIALLQYVTLSYLYMGLIYGILYLTNSYVVTVLAIISEFSIQILAKNGISCIPDMVAWPYNDSFFFVKIIVMLCIGSIGVYIGKKGRADYAKYDN